MPSKANEPCEPYPKEDESDALPVQTPQPTPLPLTSNAGDLALLLHTINFAATKHSFQRRKDPSCSPYINHPIAVANYLAQTGVTDIVTLQAAILHDVVEDTCCDIPELEREFGKEVASVVAECTDDTDLNGPDRKRRQVETAPGKSKRAHQVKLADKYHNLKSIAMAVPTSWTVSRVQAYFSWAKEVTDICADANPRLAAHIQELYDDGVFTLQGKEYPCLDKTKAFSCGKA